MILGQRPNQKKHFSAGMVENPNYTKLVQSRLLAHERSKELPKATAATGDIFHLEAAEII